MSDPLVAVGISVLVALLAAATAALLIEWRISSALRSDLVQSRAQLAAVTRDRDGWRGVAERALLVAEIGRATTEQAVRTINRLGKP